MWLRSQKGGFSVKKWNIKTCFLEYMGPQLIGMACLITSCFANSPQNCLNISKFSPKIGKNNTMKTVILIKHFPSYPGIW